LHFVGFDY